MFIPIGTDRPLKHPVRVTPILIAINAAIFVLQLAFPGPPPTMFSPNPPGPIEEAMLLIPGEFWAGKNLWTILTYAFIHAGWMHLLGNMVFLWIFGPNVEDRLRPTWFVVFYALGAIAAGLVHALVTPTGVLGASGAIAAVTGMYLVLFPRTIVRVFMLFFFIGVINVPAWWFIGGRIAWDFFLHVSDMGRNIAVQAHLGGYAFGFVIGMALLWLKVLPREQYDLWSLSRQAKRRRDFRAAHHQELEARRRRWERRDADADAIAEARADVSRRLAAGESEGAIEAYKILLSQHGHNREGTLLSRRNQYDVANLLYVAQDYANAASAYERFIEGYPTDPELPQIKLMLGRILARQLNDPVRAQQVLSEAADTLDDEDAKAMAKDELEALG